MVTKKFIKKVQPNEKNTFYIIENINMAHCQITYPHKNTNIQGRNVIWKIHIL